MLRRRVITALCGIPLLVAAVWFDRPLPWFTVLLAIWGLLAAWEFYRMTSARRLMYFGLLWTLIFILSRDSRLLSLLEPHFDPELLSPLLFTSAVVLSLFWLVVDKRRDRAFTGWAWMVAGMLYVGWLLGYLVALRGLDDGRNWVMLALLVTFGSDTAAFFVGRALGRHRLAPQISPGKTWEGAIAGICGAVVVVLLFTLPTPLQLDIGYWQAVGLGLAVSVFGQAGDLVESLLKRNTGVKDSGSLLPGHGGFLDRIDSVIFAGVVVYYYVLWVAI